MRIYPRRFPSLKRRLINIHDDLFTVHDRIYDGDCSLPLTNFEKLVLVLEDRRFLFHDGFDAIASMREVLKALTFKKHGGASTIDMQFVRTVTGYRQITIRRKVYEIFLSVLIQFRYSKLTILRSYLQCAFFGSRIYGLERAAQKIYSVSPDELTLEQAALIAAMLVYPKPLIPSDEWWIKVRRRAQYGQRRMLRFEELFNQIPIGK